jgi:hypothetical protein
MKNAKSILIGTGGFVLAGLILTMLVPRAAHGLAATLVEITNTAASPVLSQVVNTNAFPVVTQTTSSQASQIVTLNCQIYFLCVRIDGTATPIGTPTPLTLSGAPYAVPAGQALIVTSIDVLPLGGNITANQTNFQSCITNSAQFSNATSTYLACYETFSTPYSVPQASYPLASGIVISAGEVPMVANGYGPAAQYSGFAPVSTVFTLHGYLSPAPAPLNQ